MIAPVRRTARVIPLLVLLLHHRAIAQGVERFTLTRDLRIDAATADFGSAGPMLIGRNGEIVVVDDKDNILRTFSAAGVAGIIGRVGEGPGEFRNLTRTGWLGDSLWTLDPNLNRVSIFGPNHKFVRSFLMPSTIVSPKAPKDSAETVTEIYVQAALSDGSLRAIAGFRPTHRPSWAVGVDSGATLMVRITPTGVLRNRVTVDPPNKCEVNFVTPGGTGGFHIPFCAERVSTEWDGSQVVASADLEPATGAGARYRITVAGEDGTTQFSRVYPFVPVPVSAASRDSVVAARLKAFARYGQGFIDAMPKILPAKTYPPVRRIVLGRDGTVWVEERIAASGHFWRILDAKGVVLGTVSLPADVSLARADAHTLWGYETDADGLQGVVRFRLERGR